MAIIIRVGLLIAFSTGVSTCTPAPSEPMTRSEVLEAGDDVCREANEDIGRLQNDATAQDVLRIYADSARSIADLAEGSATTTLCR